MVAPPTSSDASTSQSRRVTPITFTLRRNPSSGIERGCGNTNGCQLGAWASTDGGANWAYMEGSQGGSLTNCGSGPSDYPQNWYDQGVAVDPNNPDRVFFDTFDVWFATRTGTVWNDITCGYNGGSPHPVHVDQHALAFVPGSSSILTSRKRWRCARNHQRGHRKPNDGPDLV